MKIYLTGDIHGLQMLDRLDEFSSRHPELSKKDYVIILGDVLGTDDSYLEIVERISKLNYTVLFIDGDCENYDYLNSFEISEFNKGNIHKLSENLLHLIRGEIFNFDGVKIFTFGGGDFLTKAYGLENENTLFKERIPSLGELKKGLEKLKEENNTVDFVLTHESPSSAFIYKEDIKLSFTTKLLDKIDSVVKCKWWYFGHYHHDMKVNNNKTILYEKFIRIK